MNAFIIGLLYNDDGVYGPAAVGDIIWYARDGIESGTDNVINDLIGDLTDATYAGNATIEMDGVGKILVTGLTASNVVTLHTGSTATPTAGIDEITFTAGTVYGIYIDGELTYTCAEDSGDTIYSINDTWDDGTLNGIVAATARITDDDAPAWNIKNGFREMEPSFITNWTTTSSPQTITIPTTGTGYDGTIDWYDNTGTLVVSDVFSDADMSGLAQSLPTAGDYTCEITGSFPRVYFNNGGDKDYLTGVENLGHVGWTSFEFAFYGCDQMVKFYSGDCDTSNTISTAHMLRDCNNSSMDIQISTLDISSVLDMSWMFSNNSDWPTTPDVSGFDTSSVLDMYSMLRNNSNWSTTPDVSGFDTSSVTNMSLMFYSNSNWSTTPDVSGFDTSSVLDMSQMFDDNSNWPTTPDVSGFDTSSVTNMSLMFRNNSDWSTTPDVSGFDTSSVTNMSQMFRSNSNWSTTPDVSGFDTSSVTNMSLMFYTCDNFQYIIVTGWDLTSLINISEFMLSATGLNSTGTGGYDEFLQHLQSEHVAGRLDSSLSINMGGSQYSTAGAAAHTYMTTTAGWTITDGGAE